MQHTIKIAGRENAASAPRSQNIYKGCHIHSTNKEPAMKEG